MPEIEEFITTVREISPLMETICKNGSCYRFYLLLKKVYPTAEPHYDENYHVITNIGNRFFDISGEVKLPKARPMTDEEIEFQKHFVCELSFSAISKC